MEKAPHDHIETELTGISPEKKQLLELERTGKYVFHGSRAVVDELHPRQAHNLTNEGNIPDGIPAVFASSVAEYAIFMAIMNSANLSEGNSVRTSAWTHQTPEGQRSLTFGATKESFEHMDNDAFGFVYVFNKNDFKQRDERDTVEFVSHSSLKPVQVIRVSRNDLPQSIEIITPEALP